MVKVKPQVFPSIKGENIGKSRNDPQDLKEAQETSECEGKLKDACITCYIPRVQRSLYGRVCFTVQSELCVHELLNRLTLFSKQPWAHRKVSSHMQVIVLYVPNALLFSGNTEVNQQTWSSPRNSQNYFRIQHL